MLRKLLATAGIAIVALFAIAVVFVYLVTSDPLGDMRARADALKLPADFVLVSESFTPGGLGFGGGGPHLMRTYHAAWPGACDALKSVAARSGEPLGLAPPARDYADRMCNAGTWYPAGWGGWCRGYRRYQLRLYARGEDLANRPGFDHPQGMVVLYPRHDQVPEPRIVIPPGRARVDIEMFGNR